MVYILFGDEFHVASTVLSVHETYAGAAAAEDAYIVEHPTHGYDGFHITDFEVQSLGQRKSPKSA